MIRTERVLDDITRERLRQEELVQRGKFKWTCADHRGSGLEPEKLAVLAEEFGEVARLITETIIDPDRRDIGKLRAELIQVAAVAVAWVESLDREVKP